MNEKNSSIEILEEFNKLHIKLQQYSYLDTISKENQKNIEKVLKEKSELFFVYQKNIFSLFNFIQNSNGKEVDYSKHKLFFEEICLPQYVSLSSEQSNIFGHFSHFIASNYINCAHLISELLPLLNKKEIDLLCFSTLPSFFHVLTDSNSIDSYISFIEVSYKVNNNLAFLLSRILFTHPQFIGYFRYLIKKCGITSFSEINNEDNSKALVNKILEQFKQNIRECPLYIKNLIQRPQIIDKNQLLYKSFFKEFSKNPLAFIKYLDREYDKEKTTILLDKSFKEKSSEFIEVILSTDDNQFKNIQYQYLHDSFQHYIPLYYYDILVICKMIDFGYKNYFLFDSKPIMNLFENRPITIYIPIISNPDYGKKKKKPLSFLKWLQKIFSCIDFIPIHIQIDNSCNFYSFLQQLITQMYGEKRDKLNFLIDEAQSKYPQEFTEMSIQDIYWILKNHIQRINKKNTIDYTIRQMSSMQNSVNTMCDKIKTLSELYQNLQHYLIFEICLNFKINYNQLDYKKMCEDQKSFMDSFDLIIKDWENWFMNNIMNPEQCTHFKYSLSVLHNLILQKMPFNLFISYHQEFIEEDNDYAEKIKKNEEKYVDSICVQTKDKIDLIKSDDISYYPLKTIEKLIKSETPNEKFKYYVKFYKYIDFIKTILMEEPDFKNYCYYFYEIMMMKKFKYFVSHIKYILHFLSKDTSNLILSDMKNYINPYYREMVIK